MRRYSHWFAVVTLVFLTVSAAPSLAITIEITESVGAQQGDTDQGPWSPLPVGTQLSTCKYIRLPGSFSRVGWSRVGGCGNKGHAETGLSKVKVLHVGTDIVASQAAFAGSMSFGAIDLVAAAGVDGSEASIIEEENCIGVEHCGFNSPIAQAAPLASTPNGEFTSFSGKFEDGEVRFINAATSPIPIGTSPLVGPDAGQIFMIAPGQCITYLADGSHTISDNCIPTVSEWGMVVLLLTMLIAGTLVFGFRRMNFAGTGGTAGLEVNPVTFVAPLFARVLAVTLMATAALLAGAAIAFGSLPSVDIGGAFISAIVLAYLIHLWLLLKRP